MTQEYANLQLILSVIHEGIVVVDRCGRVLYANPSAERLLDRGPLLGTLLEIAPVTDKLYSEIKIARSHDTVCAEIRSSTVCWENQPAYVIGIHDLTERKLAEDALLSSKLRLEAALSSMNDAIFISDTQGSFTDFNDAFASFHKFRNKEECAKTLAEYPEFLEIYAPSGELLSLEQWAVPCALRGETRSGAEYILRRKDTGETWVGDYSYAPIRDQHGVITGSVVTGRDISERKKSEEKLNLAASVYNNASEGIMITDATGRIIDVNDAFSRITGYGRAEVLGKNPRLLNSGCQEKEFFIALWQALCEKGHWYGEIWNRRKNGQIYAEMLNISALRDAQGHITQYVGLFHDISALKEHEKQLEHMAHYDTLTSLPNRVLLADRLQQAMLRAQRREQPLALAFLDLDGFKMINDKHGHETGDRLLISLSTRMKQALREGDTLSRIGGDEFVALLPDIADIEACEPTLIRLLEAAAAPVQIGVHHLHVSASLGVTFYPQAAELDADQLLRQADQAMYQAKLAGKNRFHLYDATHDLCMRGFHESIERIRCALLEREFVLYYQPKVNMRTGHVFGAEALIRWLHPERGLLLPAAFLPVIEEHALAVELGEWVIDTVLTQIAIWRSAGLCLKVSVNVGARQLQQLEFVDRLRVLLAAHPDVYPGNLELEVLETSALGDLIRASQVIEECRKLGVLFALDDFGAGYSSLSYLKNLPVAQLKIDQSFVRDMLDNTDGLSILEGVLSLTIAFRREAIAEGVETAGQGAMLLQLGCDLAQGYGIGPPMPANEFPDWMAAWRPDASWGDLPAVPHADLPLLFASTEHRAWITSVIRYLKAEFAAPMTLGQHNCRFGSWLDSLSLEANQPVIMALEKLHLQIHALAAELCELHALGRNQEALTRIAELQNLSDTLLDQLKLFAHGQAART